MTVLKAKIGGTFQNVLAGYASNVYTGPDAPTDPNVEFWVDTDDVLPTPAWTPITVFSGTWLSFGSTWQVPGYRKVGDVIELRGLIKNATSLTNGTIYPVATLPTGFRPPLDVMLSGSALMPGGAPGGYVPCRIDVTSAGVIQATPPNGGTVTYLSLDSVRFSVTA